MARRRICYVTGTRAEFGLMASTLHAIRGHVDLDLQLVVTGMHLSREHGRTIGQIRRGGWPIGVVVLWNGDFAAAQAVGELGVAFRTLRPDVVLLCGDRVEPFAAAAAACFDGLLLAHVHGGDRALGQADDTLRHAISKLSHIHFAATRASADRLFALGEDRFRIHTVGTPGIDDIEMMPPSKVDRRWPLVILHPEGADDSIEVERATMLLKAIDSAGIERATVVYPNNDPGWRGIASVWARLPDDRFEVVRDLPRGDYLKAMADSAMLIGNSSSGIIEAASVGTMVINLGDRQKGRERSANVIDVPWSIPRLTQAIKSIWNSGQPKRFTGKNVYGGGDTGQKIAAILADVDLDDPKLRQKLIRY